MSSASEGLIDTNVFLHSLTTDQHSEECRGFLLALEQGTAKAFLEPLVLHELSYALKHYLRQYSRADVAEYLQMVLSWDGVRGQKDVMADAVQRWRRTPGLAFVDAYLAALATQRSAVVYTKNVRELRTQGVSVPQPLPGS